MNDIVAPALLAPAAAEQAPPLELRDITHCCAVDVAGDGRQRLRVQRVPVEVLSHVSIAVAPRETVAVVGEQGAGKSTLARIASGALVPDAGLCRWGGRDTGSLSGRERRIALREIQTIGSDAWATLDPRRRVLHAIGEAPCAHGLIRRAQVIEYVGLQLNRVGIDPMRMRRFPGAFTRAEGVRLALARALAVRPAVLVIDDALRALDTSARAQLLNLVADLHAGGDLALLHLCSDIAEAVQLAERIVVLYQGRIVEQGPAAEIVATPAHPYTRALLDAARVGGHAGRQTAVRGNPPLPAMRPSGCAFHPRCPQAVRSCREEAPLLEQAGAGRAVACHVALSATRE